MKVIKGSIIYLILYTFLTSTCIISADAQPIRLRTVTVGVFNEKSVPVMNLPQSAFKVYEDKKLQTITAFASGDKPASIAVLFDLSPSLSGGKYEGINLARHSILEFIKESNPSNEYFIMGFHDEAKLVTDWTSDEEEIINGLNQLPTLRQYCSGNCSRVYDACFQAVEKLVKGKHSKRVLLIVSDGYDNHSKHSRNDLLRLAREQDILSYAMLVNVPKGYDEFHRRIPSEDLIFMMEFAELTGGYAYDILNPSGGMSAKDFNVWNGIFKKFFVALASDLKNQYEISYQPSSSPPSNDRHKIKVELDLPSNLKKQLGKLKIFYRLEYSNPN